MSCVAGSVSVPLVAHPVHSVASLSPCPPTLLGVALLSAFNASAQRGAAQGTTGSQISPFGDPNFLWSLDPGKSPMKWNKWLPLEKLTERPQCLVVGPVNLSRGGSGKVG